MIVPTVVFPPTAPFTVHSSGPSRPSRFETLQAPRFENGQGRLQANLLTTRVGLKKRGCLLRRDIGKDTTGQTAKYGGQIDRNIALDPDKTACLTGRAVDQFLNQLADSLSRAKNGRKGPDSGSVRSKRHDLNIGCKGPRIQERDSGKKAQVRCYVRKKNPPKALGGPRDRGYRANHRNGITHGSKKSFRCRFDLQPAFQSLLTGEAEHSLQIFAEMPPRLNHAVDWIGLQVLLVIESSIRLGMYGFFK